MTAGSLPAPDEKSRRDGEARIQAFRDIVRRGQWGDVDGLPFDLFTAAHVVRLDDRLSGSTRDRFRRLGPHGMAELAFRALEHKLRARGQRR